MTRIEYGPSGSSIDAVYEDFMTVHEEFIRQGHHLDVAKGSSLNGDSDQSLLEHVTNGCSVLFRLYDQLPDDHRLQDERHMRETIACFVAHDYHKLVDERGYHDEFDIPEDEAREFADEIGLWTICPQLDVRLLQAVMCGHHLRRGRSGMLPLAERVPGPRAAFRMAVAADALASTETVRDVRQSVSLHERFESALQEEPATLKTVRFHDTAGEEWGNVALRAVSNVLEQAYGWRVLRVYADGVLYLAETDANVPVSEYDYLSEGVYTEFKSLLSETNLRYATSLINTQEIQLHDASTQMYHVELADIYFNGLASTVHGIFQRGVGQSERVASEATLKERKQYVPKYIEPYVETDIKINEGGDRRVQSLARSIHTIHHVVTKGIQNRDVSMDDADGEKWDDALWATTKLLGVLTDERWRELEQLREANGEKLAYEKQHTWHYKYLLAQYVYDDYYTGSVARDRAEKLAATVLSNIPGEGSRRDDNPLEIIHNPPQPVLNLEEEYVRDIAIEMEGRLVESLKIGDTLLANEVEDSPHELHEKEASLNCFRCDGYMIDPDLPGPVTTRRLFKNRTAATYSETPFDMKIEGHDGREHNLQRDEALCIPCQVEANIRASQDTRWGSASSEGEKEAFDNDDDVLYAYLDASYGYVPLSSLIGRRGRSDMVIPGIGFDPEAIFTALQMGEVPDAVTEVHDFLMNSRADELYAARDGLQPESDFAGAGIPVCSLDNSNAMFKSITALIGLSLYTGTGVHFSTRPMAQGKSFDAAEHITFGEKVSSNLTFFEGEGIPASEIPSYIEQANAVVELVENEAEKELLSFIHTATRTPFPARQLNTERGGEWETLGLCPADETIEQLDARFGQDTLSAEVVDRTEELGVQLDFLVDGESHDPEDVLKRALDMYEPGTVAETASEVVESVSSGKRKALRPRVEQNLTEWLEIVADETEDFNAVADEVCTVSNARRLLINNH